MISPSPVEPRPWGRAAASLLFLGPFFYATYGFSNWLASQREHVAVVAFEWETRIPFLAWTIIPYWSVNFFYAASVFVCASRRELSAHVLRLVTAQSVAVGVFVLFPLRCSFVQPETVGVPGLLFEALGAFDKPYNQAPSLHVALVMWSLYATRCRGWVRALLDLWALTTVATVLTTYQHHFVDIPTGALLGWLCVWLWPLDGPSPLRGAALTCDRRRRRLGACYALAGTAFAVPAVALGAAWLWLLWPAVSVWLVALCYWFFGAGGFAKSRNGCLSVPTRWLLAPYLAGAWLNSRLWTRGTPAAVEVVDGVWLGRFPASATLDAHSIEAVVDLSAELSVPPRSRARWDAFPSLDLTVVGAPTLRAAAQCIGERRADARVLVCCALGYSRSASALCCWLLQSGRAATPAQAAEMVSRARPQVVLAPAQLDAVASAHSHSGNRSSSASARTRA